jgi:hypothetical protein
LTPIEIMRMLSASGSGGGGGGGGGGSVTLNNASASTETVRFASAYAYYSLYSGGGGDYSDAGSITTFTWLNSGSSSSYQVKATKVSGSTPSGNLGTWDSMASTNTWSLTKSGATAGTLTCSLTIQIRRVSDSVVVATATVSLTAIVDFS